MEFPIYRILFVTFIRDRLVNEFYFLSFTIFLIYETLAFPWSGGVDVEAASTVGLTAGRREAVSAGRREAGLMIFSPKTLLYVVDPSFPRTVFRLNVQYAPS